MPHWRTKFYRLAQWVLEKHERYHVIVTSIELGLAATGAFFFIAELQEHHVAWKEAGEVIVLGILTASILARWMSLMRGANLGLLANRRAMGTIPLDGTVFRELLALKPTAGHLGGFLPNPTAAEEAIAGLAHEASSVFSMKTYGEPDRFWERWEANYLTRWYAEMPEVIWRLPPEVPAVAPGTGYFSVALPITKDSFGMVRRGHLHTALAELDLDEGLERRGEAEPRGVDILIYTAQYVPAADEGWQRLTLLYCPIEHIAALIGRRRPDLLARAPGAGVRLICESPNKRYDDALGALGFEPVLQEAGEDGELSRGPRVALSPARFKLFECDLRGLERPLAGKRLGLGSLIWKLAAPAAAEPARSLSQSVASNAYAS